MTKRIVLTPEMLNTPKAFWDYLILIAKYCNKIDAEDIFNSAINLDASNKQLFNIAGVLHANRDEDSSRHADFCNLKFVKNIMGAPYYIPENRTFKIYRGLHIVDKELKSTPKSELMDFILNKRIGFESWTLNKDVAELYTMGNGVILESTIMSNTPCLLGLNICGDFSQAEVILEADELDIDITYRIRSNYESHKKTDWNRFEDWMCSFLDENDCDFYHPIYNSCGVVY